MRREIEARLGVRAFDIYGLSEIMGPGVACECEAQDGLHGWEDHFLFEIIDPDTGARGARRPGRRAGDHHADQGSAADAALPHARHHARSTARAAPAAARTRASCASTGRNDDMLIIRGVNVYPSQVEAVLIGLPDIAPHYQLVVERQGAQDSVKVEVEATPAVGPRKRPMPGSARRSSTTSSR